MDEVQEQNAYSQESELCEILIKALWTKAINELKFRGEMVERIEKRHHSINRVHESIEKKIKTLEKEIHTRSIQMNKRSIQ